MAKSQAHTFGEILGDFFEDLMKKPIREFADKHHLYFDTMGDREARDGKKVTWTDIHGSKHDLDFVLEKGGTQSVIGEPVAFIELAWRRYTRHSKNKAQEIAGAVNPICEKYSLTKPFKGAILSGQFTENSLKQLRNEGFHILYIPFDVMVEAFKTHGIDIDFDEDTKESDIKAKIQAFTKRSNRPVLDDVREEIYRRCNEDITGFVSELSASYNRKISSICVLPLHGKRIEVGDIKSAIDFIQGYKNLPADYKLEYVEVFITYNNGTVIHCQFTEKAEAVEFLNKMA